MRLMKLLDDNDVPRNTLSLAVLLAYFLKECFLLGLTLPEVKQLLLRLKQLSNPGQQTGQYTITTAYDEDEVNRVSELLHRYFMEIPGLAGYYLVAFKDLGLVLASSLGEPAIHRLHEAVQIISPADKVH